MPGAVPPPCHDLSIERAALTRAAAEAPHLADAAGGLDRPCGVPLAAGISMEGSACEAASVLADRLEAFCARAQASEGAPARPGGREHLKEILARPEFARARAPDVN